MASIDAIRAVVDSTPAIGTSPAADKPASGGFGDALTALVESAAKSESTANQKVAGMLNQSTDVHDAMIAIQGAELSLQLAVQIRNKIVQAYNDIMRMPV